MFLNDEHISNNTRFLYAVIFAHRIAECILQIIEIFDIFKFFLEKMEMIVEKISLVAPLKISIFDIYTV